MVRVYRLGDVVRLVSYGSGGDRHLDLDEPENVSMDSDADGRLDNNISRAKSTIRELGLCNPWEYFVTLTVAGHDGLHDRTDLNAVKKRWNQCVKDYNRKYGAKLKYLLVPELHKDGESWHFHGFFLGVAEASLSRNQNGYLDMPFISKRIGYVSLSKIRSLKRVSSYMTKYITKSFGTDGKVEEAKHLFIASVGLQRKELLFQCSHLRWYDWKFTNDWVSISEYEANNFSLEDLKQHIDYDAQWADRYLRRAH
ncbi:MAG: hypothetical protein LUE20_08975 [Oscillospiraceae bacterium]|nr:hypothetical protein [Oscillospiraceae bacterium]